MSGAGWSAAAAANPWPDEPDAGPWSRVILTPARMLEAVARLAAADGVAVHRPGDALVGDAEALAAEHAALASALDRRPALILSGGEAGARVQGAGQGGRNTHFLLALAIELERRGIDAFALAIDTDGIDGNSPAAGALLRPDSLSRARALGLDPQACLRDRDSLRVWRALGDAIETGPTGTNLNDLRLILLL